MLNSNPATRTVSEISAEFGIPESRIVQAVQSGELRAEESHPGGAVINNDESLHRWISANHPAHIYSSLSGSPPVPTDERMRLLARLPYLARRLVNADYAALTLGDQSGSIDNMIVSGLSDSQAITIGHPPTGKGVLGNLDHSDAPIRLANIDAHRRSTGFPDGHPDMQSMIGVGVSSDTNQDETIRIYVTRSTGRPPFSPEDQEIIESLASFARQALDIDSLRRSETELRVRAEQAERAKSEFMSMINHDLKNPIATMQAAIDMATIDSNYTEDDLINDLRSSLETQSALISSLLDMARLGKTSQDFEFEDYYPIDLINGAALRAARSPHGRDRNLDIRVPNDLPALRCDPVQLGRVFDNLLTNAFKYSEDDITINTRTSDDGTDIVFVVADNGIGIPESEQDRIFKPFERVVGANSTVDGLGLGLAICKTIVEAHGGTIAYRRISPKTGGSEFEIRLPVAS
jgi:signal transduction histidine kinase